MQSSELFSQHDMPINVKLAKSIQKLDLKAGLSQLTKKENLIAHEQLEQIDRVE